MPCFHYRYCAHPDELGPSIIGFFSLDCPICHRRVEIPTSKACPKCCEMYEAEIEYWKDRYADLLGRVNQAIADVQRFNPEWVDPFTERFQRYLIELRDRIENRGGESST